MSSLSSCYSSLFDGLNAEVQIRWLQLVVRNCYYAELPRVRAFLHKHVSTEYTQSTTAVHNIDSQHVIFYVVFIHLLFL